MEKAMIIEMLLEKNSPKFSDIFCNALTTQDLGFQK